MAGCAAGHVVPPDTAPAAAESADDAMRRALGSALQANGPAAVVALRSIDTTHLSIRYRPTGACMVRRLGERRIARSAIADPVLARLHDIYQEYWMRSLRQEQPQAANDGWLLGQLNPLLVAAGERSANNLDSLEAGTLHLIEQRGYHGLLGMTLPLRELMLWRTETEQKYTVPLPDGPETVTVVFMDDFASLGWAGFATCDRHHSGGWTKPDRLYAVRSAYDLDSENFRVSYLAHEGQHFADARRFPALEAQDRLEYRAKLVELAVADSSTYTLLNGFAANVSDDIQVPHSYANGRVVAGMRSRLSLAAGGDWHAGTVGQVNAAAAALLKEDTAQLGTR